MRPPQNAGENHVNVDMRGHQCLASMRPPQNAGENDRRHTCHSPRRAGFNEAPAKRGGKLRDNERGIVVNAASMRPPQNAGENAERAPPSVPFSDASMRPPQNAGENDVGHAFDSQCLGASMRPPQNAGENPRGQPPNISPCRGFNEAPAKRGGKLSDGSEPSAIEDVLQ